MSESGEFSSAVCRIVGSGRGQSFLKILPMGPGPEDAATARALEKLLILLRDKGRNQRACLIGRNGYQHDIAVRAAIASLGIHLKLEVEILMELAQLAFDVVALDQGVPPAEDPASGQVSVAREQPPVFAKRALDQLPVLDDLFIGRIVAENAEPAGKAAEHRIGHEAGGAIGCLMHIHGCQLVARA